MDIKVSPMFNLQVARVGLGCIVVTIVHCVVPSEFRVCLLVTLLNFLSTALDLAMDRQSREITHPLALTPYLRIMVHVLSN